MSEEISRRIQDRSGHVDHATRPFSGRGVRQIGGQSAQSVQVDSRAAIAPPWAAQRAVAPNGGTAQTQGRTQTGERGARLLKKSRRVLCQVVLVRYAFIQRHERAHSVRRMCAVMYVHPSGGYAWRREPIGEKRRDDHRVLGLLKQAWLESGCVYGYRKLTLNIRDLGEQCGKHRVARVLPCEGIRSQTGCRRRSSAPGGKPAVVAPKHLNRQFTPDQPNRSWVTDITNIRTHEGWLYLAVVIDLFSRQVIGWSMDSRTDADLVLMHS
ncbi:hypothetical protein AEP_01618 [Curvibacter sp. AEP1-3]|nr:hypothetical protein AEP_01618 [Curvibacter sp. AEP1-3]